MKLLLERIYTCKTYTIGRLYLIETNGEKKYLMDTLEDCDRGLSDKMSLDEIKKLKVYCETAIPTGTYNITMKVKSSKFSKKVYYKNYCNGYLPRLLNIKGFDGILMHRGTNSVHSCGCILVGYNKIKGKLVDSQNAFEELMEKYLIPNKNEDISIEIVAKYKK